MRQLLHLRTAPPGHYNQEWLLIRRGVGESVCYYERHAAFSRTKRIQPRVCIPTSTTGVRQAETAGDRRPQVEFPEAS